MALVSLVSLHLPWEYLSKGWNRGRVWFSTLMLGTKRVIVFFAFVVAATGLVSFLGLLHSKPPVVGGTLAIVLLFGLVLSRFPGPDTLPEGHEFERIGAELKAPFPRAPYVDHLVERLKEQERLLVVVGESGVGKTILVTKLLSKGFSRPENVVTIVGFESREGFERHLGAVAARVGLALSKDEKGDVRITVQDNGFTPVLVLDQFEQFLNAAREDEKLRLWFRHFVMNWLKSGPSNRCILVVRREFFFYFDFLRTLVDPFQQAVVVHGLSLGGGRDSADVVEIRARLDRVVKNPETVAAIIDELKRVGPILPLEVQMIGLMLEDVKNRSGNVAISVNEYQTALGGRRGLIRRYLTRCVFSSADPHTAIAVLCALSARGYIYRVAIEDLQLMTHRKQRAIGKALGVLVEGGSCVEVRVAYLKSRMIISRRRGGNSRQFFWTQKIEIASCTLPS